MSAECEALAAAEAEAEPLGQVADYPDGSDGLAGDEHSPSSLDLILDMVYQRCSLYELEGVAEKKTGIRRMWRSTFGRLPVPSQLALRYAPGKPNVAATRPLPPPACRGRLRVPSPPSPGQGRRLASSWTKLN
jgi:hypothetical protein